MLDLKLVHRSKVWPEADWNDDQFAVLCDGKPVGSIVKQSMAGMSERWWWEISTRGSPGLLKGPADSREDAMAKFRAAWDGIQQASSTGQR